jgi:hypothetical protein
MFQFMALLPSICLFMIFLFKFYANDLLILFIILFTKSSVYWVPTIYAICIRYIYYPHIYATKYKFRKR